MSIYIEGTTPRHLVNELQNIGNAEYGQLVTRPWNRYEPETSSWWLLKSTDWPAYAHAKLYCDYVGERTNAVSLALHIEKGISRKAAYALACPAAHRLAIEQEWQWFTLLKSVKTKELGDSAQKLSNANGISPHVWVNIRFIENPCEYEPYALDIDVDHYEYKWNGKSRLFELSASDTPAKVFLRSRKRVQVDTLDKMLGAIADCEWVWVDFFFGMELSFLDETYSDRRCQMWAARDVWTKLASPIMRTWWP